MTSTLLDMGTPHGDLAELDKSALAKYEIAKSKLTECKQSARLEDLDKAILLLRKALLQRPDSHLKRMFALNNLAMGLLTRFDFLGRTADLDEAISLARKFGAVKPNVLENGSDNAESNLEYISQHDDNDSIEAEKSSEPTSLARDILAEFNCSIPLSTLEASISFHLNAFRLLPSLGFECLLSLVVTLMLQFRRTSDLRDLDFAISVLDKLNSDSNIELKDYPTDVFASISAAFLTKFIVTGLEIYRKESLLWHGLVQTRMKVEVDPRAIRLFNVSLQIASINARISMLRDALELIPKLHPARGPVLNNLGNNIHMRFEETGDRSDLDEAIVLYREALSLLPVSYPHRPTSHSNLANAIWARFEQTGNLSDLVLLREALSLLPAPNPGRPISPSNSQ